MRIVFILEYYEPHIGGVEQLFSCLANALIAGSPQRTTQVVVVTSRYRKDLPVNEIKNHGLTIIRVGRNRFWFTVYAFLEAVKQVRVADLVHTTSYNAALPAYVAARICHKPIVITFHEFWGKLWFTLPYMNQIQRLGYALFEKLIVKLRFDCVVGVSDFTVEALKKQTSQKVVRIYNGLDYASFSPAKAPDQARAFTFSFFGRAGSSKGLDLLLPAAEKFLKHHPEAVFQLIMPEDNTKAFCAVKSLIDKFEAKAQLKVYYNLDRKSLLETISAGHCVVIPSYSEGFCFAAAETIAMEIPVISSGKGALPEVVSGRYIQLEQHSVAGLVDALVKASQKQWAQTDVRHFHLNETIEAYLKLYNEVL